MDWADFDKDGLLDVFVGNEFSPSQLFRNCTVRPPDSNDGCALGDTYLSSAAVWAYLSSSVKNA